jgi:AcrR family transcriptional regulator
MVNMRSVGDDRTAAARIRDAAIDQWGRHGFQVGLRSIAEAAGVSAALVIHHYGSREGLRRACDEYVTQRVRAEKSASLQTNDPRAWFAQMAAIESYAPLMAYLVRSMQSGGELSKTLWRNMVEDTEQYVEEGVRNGVLKPSDDPSARARFLTLSGVGSFLLYLQMHPTPDDLRAVLRDYSEEMLLPGLEIYTRGLLADSTKYDAFLARHRQGIPMTAREGDGDDGSDEAD